VWDSAGYGDILSEENRTRIAARRTPMVDEAWITHFPEDAGLKEQLIPMHHIGGDGLTVPLPWTRHLDAHMPGGYGRNTGGPGAFAPFYFVPPVKK
jgi:filamentous hemagglutinin